MTLFVDGHPLTLPPDSFVAAGGEATVHALGDVAYKVAHAPMDAARLRALAALRVPRALLPQRPILDEAGRTMGHTMRFLPRSTPLSRALARGWRDRHGLDPDGAMRLVRALRDVVASVHDAGALVVDLHEGNVLLDEQLEPVLIDTSSWQLPGFPATAIQDTVRDRHARGFDRGTDWFAFAVLATHLLLGVHPYRGHHPTVKGLDARMIARLSVLRPEVRTPPSCYPAAVIPTVWRTWLGSVLDGAHRGPPPAGAHDTVTWSPAPTPAARHLVCVPVLAGIGALAVAETGGVTALRLADGVRLGGRVVPGRFDALTITADGRALAAAVRGGQLRVVDLDRGEELPCTLQVDDLAPLGPGFVVRSGPRLLQIELRAGVLVPRLLASVLPHATHLFHSGAVQDLLGACHLLLLSPGRCDLRRVPELDGWTVLDLQHAGGVALVTARRAGRTDRCLFRFGPGGYELRRTEDVDGVDADLVVLPSGVGVVRVESRLELFRARPGDPELRLVEDPMLASGRLVALGDQLGWLGREGLHRLTMA